MNSALLAALVMAAFALGYRFYSRFIAEKIFALKDNSKDPTPAVALEDGVDYVATPRAVLWGHHYSSIAGAAPIVGPAVAVIWGWLPAVLWIALGTVFIGAVHDFGALVVSMRHKGESIGQVAERVLGPRVRTLFLWVIFFLVWMVIAVFALVIANLFVSFPSSVLPVNFQILVAIAIGYVTHRRGVRFTLPALAAQVALWGTIVLGTYYPISLRPFFGESELMVWIVFLLIYSYVASVLPVWLLLQPRDYINSHQLFLGLGLLLSGLLIVQPEVVAPAFNPSPEGAPPWFPFLFITIACGAVSGFHGLVSSGTTSKQVARWSDARPIGYSAMLGEGLLALIATLAAAAGFASREDWHHHYASWAAADGFQAKINAFVLGSGRFLSGLGIPEDVAATVIAVLIISFAATSLDTAARIQRYVLSELGRVMRVRALENRHVAGGVAVGTAYLLMALKGGGKGGLLIWPLFGATNQMLAALTLLVVGFFLKQKKRPAWPFFGPAVIMLVLTTVGLVFNIHEFWVADNSFLATLAGGLLLIQIGIVAEGMRRLRGHRHER